MSNVIELLQKMLAHQASAEAIGSAAEAEAFAAKVQDLLLKNNLTMSDIEIQEQDANEPVDEEKVFETAAGRKRRRSAWMEILAGAVAQSMFCKHLIATRSNAQFFIGRTSDRLAAVAMFKYLVAAGLAVAAQDVKVYKETRGFTYAADTREWHSSFLRGYAAAIASRLDTDRITLMAENEERGEALVLRKDLAVKEWMAAEHPNIKAAGEVGRGEIDTDGFLTGRARGSSISLNARAALGGSQ